MICTFCQYWHVYLTYRQKQGQNDLIITIAGYYFVRDQLFSFEIVGKGFKRIRIP